ncbi:ribosomal RNA-processing protein 8 [Leptopilina heterotoma]|uniref:ribosomal RNA-processing protein 8 n=1 Tax=Leptopilina heterotoma TaxID=63436 RepID=UPI001CA89802|nr:ribosomal RNA-processing protein 8 [Leptopilina heterotoma]
MSVKKRKFKRNRRQNLEENELMNSSVSKEKKKKKFSSQKETMNFNSPKKMVLGKMKNENKKKIMENRGKMTNKRNRSEIEGEKEEVIESKKRRKSKKNKSNALVKNSGKKSQLNKKIDVNTLKGMLMDKEEEKNKPNWENSSSTLRERMIAQLRSSRFRFINETLYNNASFESKKYFKDDPEAFDAYHKGFQQQVDNWPLNPVDIIIESIKKCPKDYIVADFGCGEAKIAESVSQKVHSFDFVAMNDKVTVCDMAHTPLLKSGVNIVVFCLSLMGTNLNDYLLEANRVLKKGGIMKIAEVESRFENIEDFIKLVTNYGFVNTWSDLSNDLFYFLDFKKEKDLEKGKSKLPAIELKPCLYKRR